MRQQPLTKSHPNLQGSEDRGDISLSRKAPYCDGLCVPTARRDSDRGSQILTTMRERSYNEQSNENWFACQCPESLRPGHWQTNQLSMKFRGMSCLISRLPSPLPCLHHDYPNFFHHCVPGCTDGAKQGKDCKNQAPCWGLAPSSWPYIPTGQL